MTAYNRNFELTVEDLDLIETALLSQTAALAGDDEAAEEARAEARRIQDLLGRLHNQKVWYRPKNTPYIGG